MSYFKRISLLFYLFIFLFSCREPQHKKEIIRMDLAKQTGLMEQRVSENLKKLLDYAAEKQGALNDSVRLSYLNLMDSLYESKEYEPIWSKDQQWLPLGDSLFNFIANSKNYGLFPADYHYRPLSFIRRIFMADSLTRKNALLWSRSDILLTDALFKLVKDIKQGRFKYDSVTLRTDTVLAYAVYKRVFDSVFLLKNLPAAFRSLEPEYKGYDSLKAYIPGFLSKADFKPYTYLVYPYIDSVSFFGVLEKRFHELGLLSQDTLSLDTTAFQKLLRRYQRSIGMKPTGKLTDQLVDAMNNTDWEKFKRIAVNLDRYKLLPDSLPSTHIWVNLP